MVVPLRRTADTVTPEKEPWPKPVTSMAYRRLPNSVFAPPLATLGLYISIFKSPNLCYQTDRITVRGQLPHSKTSDQFMVGGHGWGAWSQRPAKGHGSGKIRSKAIRFVHKPITAELGPKLRPRLKCQKGWIGLLVMLGTAGHRWDGWGRRRFLPGAIASGKSPGRSPVLSSLKVHPDRGKANVSGINTCSQNSKFGNISCNTGINA